MLKRKGWIGFLLLTVGLIMGVGFMTAPADALPPEFDVGLGGDIDLGTFDLQVSPDTFLTTTPEKDEPGETIVLRYASILSDYHQKDLQKDLQRHPGPKVGRCCSCHGDGGCSPDAPPRTEPRE